jgi:hypothetical protein
MSTAAREGFLYAASVFAIVFIALTAIAWTAWSSGYLRPKNEEEPRGLPSGVEARGVRFIAEGDSDGIDQHGFRVVVDDLATMRSVVAAFTGAQLLRDSLAGTGTGRCPSMSGRWPW